MKKQISDRICICKDCGSYIWKGSPVYLENPDTKTVEPFCEKCITKNKNVLAYIIKTEKGKCIRIFCTERLAVAFLFDLINHGCELKLHIEEKFES